MHEEIKKELAALAVLCIELNCEKFQPILELCGYQIQTGSSIGMFTLKYVFGDVQGVEFTTSKGKILHYTVRNLKSAQDWLKSEHKRVISYED